MHPEGLQEQVPWEWDSEVSQLQCMWCGFFIPVSQHNSVDLIMLLSH